MAEFLVIRLGDSATESVSWIAADDRGTRHGHPQSGSLADAAGDVGERSVILLVPGADVLTLSADIPAKGARLLATLPFALEDQLADDIEHLHFAAGARRADRSIPVAVVARAKLDEWLARLREAGITPARVVPENHGLARTPNTLSLLVDRDTLMFNDGDTTEFMMSGMRPSDALAVSGLLDDESASSGHLLVYCDATMNAHFEKDWAVLRQQLASVDVNLLPDGALPRLAVTAASGAGVNLLQGHFGARPELGGEFRPWRYAAMLLLALGLLGILGKAADLYRLNGEQQVLETQFAEEYRRIRPNDTREIVDPAGTVSSLRRSLGAPATGPQVFLPSLKELAQAVAGNKAVRIEAISYRAGVIDVRLTAPDIPTLDKIVQAVGTSGQFAASMQSADRVGEQVNGRIQIRESGA